MNAETNSFTVTKVFVNGKEYELNDDGGWVTMTKYARLFNLKINIVNNWISRGIITDEDIIEVPELNNIKLIKAKKYNPRTYIRDIL